MDTVATDELGNPEEEAFEMSKTQEIVREKILHVLHVYPGISETMLQVGIGPTVKPEVWRPVLEYLIDEAFIHRETIHLKAPSNRFNRYTKLTLNPSEHVEGASGE